MIIFALIVVGLIFGSFCNAVIWRLHEQMEPTKKRRKRASEQDLSIVTGRSMCNYCGHQLSAGDLIPVVSYLWLRGRCRYCGKPIDDTPLAELLTPLLFVASYIWWPYDMTSTTFSFGQALFGLWLTAMVCFVILTIYDLKWYLLPDRVVFPLIGLASIAVLLHATVFGGGLGVVLTACWGVVAIAGLFYVLYVVSKGSWIGFGDVKLAVALGLLVGGPIQALLLLFVASLSGSVASIPLLIQGKPMNKTRIPFGPFLMFAAVVVVLFGPSLTSWYSRLLLG